MSATSTIVLIIAILLGVACFLCLGAIAGEEALRKAMRDAYKKNLYSDKTEEEL